MYSRTFWLDHALSETNKFKITADSESGVYIITPYGTVMQQGVPQDANHFNNIEEGLTAHETAVRILALAVGQNIDKIAEEDARTEVLEKAVDKLHTVETGTVNLTNTAKYPFNNSVKSVALKATRNTPDYIVVAEIETFNGNVGEIVVSDVLANGFKIAFTGSAKSATVSYKILGGYTR